MGVTSAGLGHGSTFFFELPLYGSRSGGALTHENNTLPRTPSNLSVQDLSSRNMWKPALFRKSAPIYATSDDEISDQRNADGDFNEDEIAFRAVNAINHAGNADQQGKQEPSFVCVDVISEGRSETSITRAIGSQPINFHLSEPQPTLYRILLVVGYYF